MQEPTEKLPLLFTRCEDDTFHFLLNVTYVHMLLITGCEGDMSVLCCKIDTCHMLYTYIICIYVCMHVVDNMCHF